MKKSTEGVLDMDEETLWAEMQGYLKGDYKRRVFNYNNCTAELYMGAMSIALLALWPKRTIILGQPMLDDLSKILHKYKLELEYVEEGNYKINRADTKAYVGRLTNEGLKLSIKRLIEEIGSKDLFKEIVDFYVRAVAM